MAGASSDFCFPCTGCGRRFDSLRLLRKHKCGTTQDTIPDTNTQVTIQNTNTHKVNGIAARDFAEKTKVEHSKDLPKGLNLDTIQQCEASLDIKKECDNKVVGYVVDTTNNKNTEIFKSGKPKKTEVCIPCDTEFTRYDSYSKHLRRHKEKSTISCDFEGCLKQVFNERDLTKHKRSAHGINKVKSKDLCLECGKAFKSPDGLKLHMKRHNNIFDYECESCEKKFVSKSILNIHNNTSHTEASFACEFCGNKYTTKTYLKIHITSHTGEKSRSCSFCNKQFRRYETWKNHENVHRHIRNYKCKLCHKEFGRHSELTIHTKRHNNQRDHVCPVCSKGFIEPAGLRRHKCLGHPAASEEPV